MERYKFWKTKWREKAEEENPFIAAGASNFAKNPIEFLHNLNYIVKNLRLQKEDIVLDVGCSTGLYCIPLTHWVREIKGIDYIPELVKRANQNTKSYPNIEIKIGDLLDIPFETNSFNKILAGSIIQYLEDIGDIKRAFGEIKRVVRKRGKVLVSLIPDAGKKEQYLNEIWKLNLPKEQKEEIYAKNEAGLWFHPERLLEIAQDIPLEANILSIPTEIWQSWYMFSLLFEDNG